MAQRHQRYNRAARCAKSQQRYAVGDVVRYVGPVEQTMLVGYSPSEQRWWRRLWKSRLGTTGVVVKVYTPKGGYSWKLTPPEGAKLHVKFEDGQGGSATESGDYLRADQVEFVASGGGMPEEPQMVFRKPKYKEGQRVVLAEFDNGDEVIPEEVGTIEDFDPDSRMYIVTVEDEYLVDEDDDGLREVEESQIKGLAE